MNLESLEKYIKSDQLYSDLIKKIETFLFYTVFLQKVYIRNRHLNMASPHLFKDRGI